MWILKDPRNQSQTQTETKFLQNETLKHKCIEGKKKKSMFWSGGLNTFQKMFILLYKTCNPLKDSQKILHTSSEF
jgi:hypothetical protein